MPLPRQPIGYVVAFLLGMTSLFAIGLLVAAVAPSNRRRDGRRDPDVLRGDVPGRGLPAAGVPAGHPVRIGDFTPPGVQGLQDAWMGTAPQLAPLLGMAVLTVLVGSLAVRVFRWE